MKPSPVHHTRAPEWLPLLAAAVVHQALADASDPSLPAAVRREARRFLAGSPEYRDWGKAMEAFAH